MILPTIDRNNGKASETKSGGVSVRLTRVKMIAESGPWSGQARRRIYYTAFCHPRAMIKNPHF